MTHNKSFEYARKKRAPLNSVVMFKKEIIWKYTQSEINWPELANLYRVAPLGEKNPKDLKLAFSNSRYKCFLYQSGSLVGAGRTLADGVDCSYICDIAILPEHQGTGLGMKILLKLVELSEGHKKIILYSAPGKEDFYKKAGFKIMNTAMAIFTDSQNAIELGIIKT